MRVRDWQSRLAAVAQTSARRPFAWGEHDCVLWAAACVEALRGSSPLQALRGADGQPLAWRSEREALRVLERGGGLAAWCARALGAEVAPALAQPGDVGMFDEGPVDGRHEALAVWLGAHWAAPGPAGLVQVRTEAVRRCWRSA